jgi:uncharacterized protein YbjT (DUF2867 family)
MNARRPPELAGPQARRVFVTGASGYIASRLIPVLAQRGHQIAGLARTGRRLALPPGCTGVTGDALDAKSFRSALAGADTLVHLVGVAHPSPAKAAQFQSVDFASVKAALDATRGSRIRHFVYVSVAQPAPVMRAYVAARAQAETLLRQDGIPATILRPWYVLGPGHRWPLLLSPAYWIAQRLGPTREFALRLGLVSIGQMVTALTQAVESPHEGLRIVEVADIRRATLQASGPAPRHP